jgi:hypothetical protein
MAEQDTGKMTEWLDIKLDTLSSEELIRLIEEIFLTFPIRYVSEHLCIFPASTL